MSEKKLKSCYDRQLKLQYEYRAPLFLNYKGSSETPEQDNFDALLTDYFHIFCYSVTHFTTEGCVAMRRMIIENQVIKTNLDKEKIQKYLSTETKDYKVSLDFKKPGIYFCFQDTNIGNLLNSYWGLKQVDKQIFLGTDEDIWKLSKIL